MDNPTLIIVETALYKHHPGDERPLSSVGHYFEEINAFSQAWGGHVILLSPTSTPRFFPHVDEYVALPNEAQPEAFLAYRKSPTRRSILRLLNRLKLTAIVSTLLRLEYESFPSKHTGTFITETAAKHHNSIVLIPTASERIVEGIVANLASTSPTLSNTTRFIPIWHFNDKWNPDLTEHFAQQLARWTERAKPWAIQHAAALELNSGQLSQPQNQVAWLPWPLSNAVSATPLPLTPRIYIYSVRTEHGRRILPQLCSSILEEYSGEAQLRFWVSRLSLKKLTKFASDPKVEVMTQEEDFERFQHSLLDITLAILPYDVDKYKNRGSAVLLNFMKLRVPVIVPADTGLGDFVEREGVGLSYKNIGEIAMLSRKLLSRRPQYVDAINVYMVKHMRASQAFHPTAKELDR
jgi:hypothetical protein